MVPTAYSLVVDGAGRVYCIATGINKGLIKYEADGQFSGFVGATPVVFDFMDYVWKRLASQEQRDKLLNFVPTEYDNIYRDHDGFIYTVCSTLAEEDLRSESAQAVRKLNQILLWKAVARAALERHSGFLRLLLRHAR